MDNKQRRGLTYREYLQREEEPLRAPYDPEMSFYNLVRMGDIVKVTAVCAEPLSERQGMGRLSDNPVMNLRYHFVVTAAMLARVCIDGGMELAQAYMLSDFYIRKADTLYDINAICQLHRTMCIDYAERMRCLRKVKICSKHIVNCIEYICNNLNTRITLTTLAAHVGISREYLSRLFRAETGKSVSEYITDKKLETAENMLLYSDCPITWISEELAFSSQSYFTECFRKRTGLTPLQFRNREVVSRFAGQ